MVVFYCFSLAIGNTSLMLFNKLIKHKITSDFNSEGYRIEGYRIEGYRIEGYRIEGYRIEGYRNSEFDQK